MTQPMRLHRVVMYCISTETLHSNLTYKEYYGLPSHCFSRAQENFIDLNWHDGHELNLCSTPPEKFDEYFSESLPPMVDRPFRPLTEMEEENKRLKEENRKLKSKLQLIANALV